MLPLFCLRTSTNLMEWWRLSHLAGTTLFDVLRDGDCVKSPIMFQKYLPFSCSKHGILFFFAILLKGFPHAEKIAMFRTMC